MTCALPPVEQAFQSSKNPFATNCLFFKASSKTYRTMEHTRVFSLCCKKKTSAESPAFCNTLESIIKSLSTQGWGCQCGASAVALKPSTTAGSGAATTHTEAAAVGKSRGKTTLNWVITWKFKWLHKCIAAVAAGAHGATLGEFFFLVLLPAQTRRSCVQNPHK